MVTGKHGQLQGATNIGLAIDTLAAMEDGGSADYWRTICARALKEARAAVDQTDEEIARYVQAVSGKRTSRPQLNLILSGKREPYISQFIALCSILKLSPGGVLRGEVLLVSEANHRLASPTRKFTALIRTQDQREAAKLLGETVRQDKTRVRKKG